MKKQSTPRKKSPIAKLDPIPVRFDEVTETSLRSVAGRGGWTISHAVRLLVKYTLNRVGSGEVSLQDITSTK